MRWPLLVASLATGCSVPAVTFGPDAATDAGVDGATEASSGLDAADRAAPTLDAPFDAGGAVDTACPQGLPDGASFCCGSVPCKGAAAACQGECTNCENNCPGQTCCLDKHGNYQGCASSPSTCPQ